MFKIDIEILKRFFTGRIPNPIREKYAPQIIVGIISFISAFFFYSEDVFMYGTPFLLMLAVFLFCEGISTKYAAAKGYTAIDFGVIGFTTHLSSKTTITGVELMRMDAKKSGDTRSYVVRLRNRKEVPCMGTVLRVYVPSGSIPTETKNKQYLFYKRVLGYEHIGKIIPLSV